MPRNNLQTYLTDQQRQQRRVSTQLDDVDKRNPPGASLVGTFLQIPQLRGYWPFTSVNESGNVLDLSGQGRTLTNNSSAAFGLDGVVSYGIGDGTADYFSRADEAGLSITGALSFGCYAYFNSTPTGTRAVMGKYLGTGNQRSYIIHSETAPTWNVTISPDGTAAASVLTSSTVTLTPLLSTFVVAVFVPSTSLTLYVSDNGLMTPTINTTSIPASIFDSTAAFTMLAQDGPGTFVTGRVSNGFVSTASLSQAFVQWLFDSTRWSYGV